MKAFISALPGVFDAIDASDEVREAFVFAAWRHVGGGQVAERTSPIAVIDEKLIIAVADKTWKLNLESLASQLLFRLNAALGRGTIGFIEFYIAPERIPRCSKDEESSPERMLLPDELSSSLATICDDELRRKVQDAARACLSRKQAISYLDSESIN